MFRALVRVACKTTASKFLTRNLLTNNVLQLHPNYVRNFVSLVPHNIQPPSLLSPPPTAVTTNNNIISRNVIKFSIRRGRRKTVRVVLTKFYRLAWGGWIRRKAGCHKRLWKKSPPQKRRLRQHVLCNATQSRLLDKMVGSYWRKRKYYVDDPYEPYHTREEYEKTYRIPKPYFPPESS